MGYVVHVSSFYRTCKGKHTVYQWILWVIYAQYNNNSITRTNTKKSGFGVLDMVEDKTFWDQGWCMGFCMFVIFVRYWVYIYIYTYIYGTTPPTWDLPSAIFPGIFQIVWAFPESLFREGEVLASFQALINVPKHYGSRSTAMDP